MNVKKEEKTLISVVMPVYNAEDHLEESIESILSQSFENFEFIIIDDCSEDNSKEIIDKYRSKDKRIKLLRNEENKGATYSINKGIKKAKGKYIARMDADDISKKERLEKQYEFMEENEEVAALGTKAWNINEEGEKTNKRNVPETNEEIMNIITLMCPMIHPSVMLRKEKIEEVGLYNEDLRKAQDYDLWFRLAAKGYKMHNLQERLLLYRLEKGRSFKDRITETKIKWRGYKKLGIPIHKRYGIFIHLTLGLIPNFIMKKVYNKLRKFDPRER